VSEQHRHACECRYWLSWTGGNRAMIDDLLERIAKRRGQAARGDAGGVEEAEWQRLAQN